ncbi:DUF7547 family protein [Halobaculum gomorrense]|uniref:Uncharacterized protein n=1 Tax=Halobaculum gomorrense TaxID=43928 RepID=A0A1M5SFU1_9EURY|nr:hypothetical protein [Halobaculum gomorrense]SHH36753.1 hypothetical protein SAMN05443636_2432 [Halobaculum gomorrense]
MSQSSRGRDDDDLETLVSELEATLSDLRAELVERERAERRTDERGESGERSTATRWERRDRGRRPPRPPSPGELFRFTSDYTIPTVVALLEATIEALELLRGVIDLAAPGEATDRRRPRGSRRGRRDPRDLARSVLSDAVAGGVSSATDRAATDAADALERLRETLSEADIPEDEESRDLVADARELSAELERWVRQSREAVDRERARERRADRGDDDGAALDDGTAVDDGPVSIEVGEPGEPGDPRGGGDRPAADHETSAATEPAAEDEGAAPEVDVDAELESIKREVGRQNEGDGDDTNGTEAAGDGDGDDAGDGRAV